MRNTYSLTLLTSWDGDGRLELLQSQNPLYTLIPNQFPPFSTLSPTQSLPTCTYDTPYLPHTPLLVPILPIPCNPIVESDTAKDTDKPLPKTHTYTHTHTILNIPHPGG